MPTVVLPQSAVFQDFANVPNAVLNPLPAHISGPHAGLIRYAEASERELGSLGYYDRLLDTAYAWPQRPVGAKVDTTYLKLWVKDAILKYYEHDLSAGMPITKTAGYSNRVHSGAVNFVANGSTYPRDAVLLDRDVQVGDVAKVRGVDGHGNSITLWTFIKSVIGDAVAGTFGAAAGDAANPTSESESTSVAQTAGDINCVVLTANGASYQGLTSGDVTETYDVLVTESSTHADYTTAVLRVISGSGGDDVAALSPKASGVAFAVGTRGLTLTFTDDPSASCSASATAESVSPSDLIAGQRWRVSVTANFTAPVATSGGSYAGTATTTYVVTVTRGGRYTDTLPPQVSVTTTTGVDRSGPTAVTAAATPVDVGTLGVTVEFSAVGLNLGDRYYITATGQTVGAMRTLELGNSLDPALTDGTEVEVLLFIRKPLLQVDRPRVGFAPTVNWTADPLGQFTVAAGIIAYDPTWTDAGVQQPLPLYSESSVAFGGLYLEIRYWLQTLVNKAGTVASASGLDALISGALTPDNPLKWGVSQALTNANGIPVGFTAVADPDDDATWADVLEVLLGQDDAYGLVPLTRRRSVLDLYYAHVVSQSNEVQTRWRVLWTNLAAMPEVPLVSAGSDVPGHAAATTTDGDVALATVTDDPNTAGTQYTFLRCTGNNAAFLTNGVRAGDVVRAGYGTDGFGTETYSTFTVATVTSEDELLLTTGPVAAISVAARFEVWRTLKPTEEAQALAAYASSWSDRRVRATWPDTIDASGTTMDGYFLNCALAALTGGVLPHQGVTNVEVSGFTAAPESTAKFNRGQLDVLSTGGVWVVSVDPVSGLAYTRFAVTTASYANVDAREEVRTRNIDSVNYRMQATFQPFYGIANVTPVIEARLVLEGDKTLRNLQSEAATALLGGQIVSGAIIDLRPHATELDHYMVTVTVTLPYPFNKATVHFVIYGLIER